MSDLSFSSLPLSQPVLNNLRQLDYHQMTLIQQKSLPLALKRKDLIAKAKTGSGKTAAFTIGLLANISQRLFACQVKWTPTIKQPE